VVLRLDCLGAGGLDVKRLAILIGAGALTCFLILLSSDLIGRSEPPRAAVAEAPVATPPRIESAAPEAPVRHVRVVLPAPFSAEP
jgi:hypothetical protein